MKDIFDLIARIFLAFIFFYEAYDYITHFEGTKQKMAAIGLSWHPSILLSIGIIGLIIGSVLILIGYRSKLGAFILLLYILPITLIVHSWWNDPAEIRHINSILFMKNLAIMGGLLMVVVNGSGKYSVRKLFATTRVP